MLKEAEVRAWIVSYLAELLDIEENQISPSKPFRAFGLDSADAVIVGGALEERFDIEVDATLFLRSENIDALIADLRELGLFE